MNVTMFAHIHFRLLMQWQGTTATQKKAKVFIQVKSGCFCVLQLPTIYTRCWQIIKYVSLSHKLLKKFKFP